MHDRAESATRSTPEDWRDDPKFAGLEAFFKSDIEPDVQAMEQDRKRRVTISRWVLYMGCACGVFAFLAALHYYPNQDSRLWFLCGVAPVVVAIVIGRPSSLKTYTERYLLPSHNADKFSERLSGYRNDFGFSLVECELFVVRRLSGSGSNRRSVFKGVLVWIDLPDTAQSGTVTFPRKSSTRVRLLGRETTFTQTKINREDFDDVFAVYESDANLAASVLTEPMTTALMRLDQAHSTHNLRGQIDDGVLFLALENLNKFEMGGIGKTLAPQARLDHLVEEIRTVYAIADAVIAARSTDQDPEPHERSVAQAQ